MNCCPPAALSSPLPPYAPYVDRNTVHAKASRFKLLICVIYKLAASFFEYQGFRQHMAIYNTFMKIQNKHICCPPAALSSPLPPYAPYAPNRYVFMLHMSQGNFVDKNTCAHYPNETRQEASILCAAQNPDVNLL